ncbi:MAG: Eco57I restriction-modification methylase domain-containing protein [Planctomycetota bacterium]|nr:Eco57I restriction-modification methylase domain-containing protein [Planctomycetota bacterium]
MERVNAFDWEREFPQILGPKVPKRRRGFDAVIGNPPYVRPHNLAPAAKAYFWGHYSTFVKKADIYCCFIERGISLLRSGGLLGFIVSDGWLRLDSFEKMRRHLLDSTTVMKILDFTGFVFPRANVLTCILVLSRARASDNAIEVARSEPGANICEVAFRTVPQEAFASTYKCIFDVSMDELAERVKHKIKRMGRCLGEGVDISFGLKTGDDSKFLTRSKRTARHKPLLRGENVHRYSIEFEGEYVWYVPEEMTAHRRTARPGSSERFEQQKVLVRDTGAGLQATLDCEGYYVKDVLIVSDPAKSERRLKMVLGLLNSRLMRFYYETSFPTLHVQRDELASLPLLEVDPGDPVSTEICDRMVALVERMLDLNTRLAKARSVEARSRIERLIDATDRKLDKLVYGLYNLTAGEIRIVEESLG